MSIYLIPCPSCGTFNLAPTETLPLPTDPPPDRVHLECHRCRWLGSAEPLMKDGQLTGLLNPSHHPHFGW